MLYLAILPLLAIPGVLAGLVPRERIPEGNDGHQYFLDPLTGKVTTEGERYAKGFTSGDCTGTAVRAKQNIEEGEGFDMEYRDYIIDPSIKSFQPGGQVKAGFDMKSSSAGMLAGTFCLMKYTLEDGKYCIDDENTSLFRMEYEDPAYCINVEAKDGKEYAAFNFERTYDHWPKCPTGCYDLEWAPQLPKP